MRKVAVNGHMLPLAPVAAALAAILAAIGFFLIPQGLLEAVVSQLHLDTMLPAAKPPLGLTARVLAAIGAGLGTGALTALLAIVLERLMPPTSLSRRRTIEATNRDRTQEFSPTTEFSPAIDRPQTAVEASEKKAKRFSFRQKEKPVLQDEEPVARRRRGPSGDLNDRASVFAEVETLPVAPTVEGRMLTLGDDRRIELPEWAFAEDCDLAGSDSMHGSDDEAPLVLDSGYVDTRYAEFQAAFPQAPLQPIEISQADETGTSRHDGPSFPVIPDTEEPAAGFDGAADWGPEAPLEDHAVAELAAEPTTAPAPGYEPQPAVPAVDRRSLDTASIDDLLDRIETGLARRSATLGRCPAGSNQVGSNQGGDTLAATDNLLARLADKEAEVDESLQASLRTLARMSRGIRG